MFVEYLRHSLLPYIVYHELVYLDQERQDVKTKMRVSIIEVFDNAFGPLETFFAKVSSRVQRHHSPQIFQPFSTLRASLKTKKGHRIN